ncbi:MAG: RAD55 family ATPase [Nitrosopumilus sp.]
MEKTEVIEKLKESMKNAHGDYRRTEYVIERLQNNAPLPKSDHLYIERMIKTCEQVTEKIEIEIIPEPVLPKDLIKCYKCDLQIDLDEKSIRKNNFWFHDRCFEKIPIVKTQVSQKIEVQPKRVKPVIKDESKITYSQMIFSGGLLASLVGTMYFLAGDIIATVVGVCGSVLYFTIYKPQTRKKKQDAVIVKTGIPGFDSTLSVGLKKNSSVVVSGPPGSGKTTFGLQFIYFGAREFDEPGVYISLSQSVDEIKNDCKTFGWNIDDLMKKGKILMIDLRPFKIQDEVIGRDDSFYRGEQIPFEHLTKFILNSIKKIKAKRIVIDSISILGMQYSDKLHMRQGLQGMIQSLENFEVTSLLISEFSENNQVPSEWFVTSGIIQLDNQIIDNKMRRTIKITKLRGIEHSEQVHSLELRSNGLYVFD